MYVHTLAYIYICYLCGRMCVRMCCLYCSVDIHLHNTYVHLCTYILYIHDIRICTYLYINTYVCSWFESHVLTYVCTVTA